MVTFQTLGMVSY